ncbi:MAG: HNH endonuclease signature motif containing protein [Planctomycetota bacterium]
MKTIESKLPFNYKTIKITQSRIDKGLLAIPVSLIDYFPKHKTKIYMAYGDNSKATAKNFTPYTSSSRECRIGGMKRLYERLQIKNDDELVIQILDKDRYRIFTEKQFENKIIRIEEELDKSEDEVEVGLKLEQISTIANFNFKQTLLSEFYRLSKKGFEKRKYNKPKLSKTKEGVPVSLRIILSEIYNGKCQISGFGFLMETGNPYFEIHHIKPDLGDHLKNLLVVSPNVHAQFTYAKLEELFDEEGWLRRVKFNNKEFVVNHIIDKIPKKFIKEIHY